MPGPPSASRRSRADVLCLTDDPELRAELVELVGRSRARAVVPGPDDLDREWSAASVVLLDPACASLADGLPRRDSVVVVTAAPGGRGASEDEEGPPGEVWRAAVTVGAEHVAVLPEALGWLRSRIARAGSAGARVIGVIGSRGGAGATTVAVVTATTAAATGASVLLVDADDFGGGVDLALGAEDLPGLRWPDLADVTGPLPPGGLAAALPVADGVVLLSHARAAVEAARVGTQASLAVLDAARSEYDVVVVDLPRTPTALARQALARLDLLVCVLPVEVRACAAAAAVLAGSTTPAPVHLLLRGPAPGGLSAVDAADAVRAGVAGTGIVLGRTDHVRPEPGLAAALDRGEPFAVGARSPLRRWAARTLEELVAVDRPRDVA